MPTPNKYKEIVIKILPFQWYFLGMTGVGILLSIASIFLSVKYQVDLLFMHGIGLLLVIWGWGLFLAIGRFGENPKITIKFPAGIIIFSEWFSSVFFNIWFIAGSIATILFICASI